MGKKHGNTTRVFTTKCLTRQINRSLRLQGLSNAAHLPARVVVVMCLNEYGIQIGVTGLIKTGEYSGWQVLVQNDFVNTGGYLILVSRSFSIEKAEGFDAWVESEAAIISYFEESKWVVQWH